MRKVVVATALALLAPVAAAQLSCPLGQADCSHAFARLNTTVELAFPRTGDANYSYFIGGNYGDHTPAVVANGATFQADLQVRSSNSLLAEAYATTSDGLVFANASAGADLAAGQVRAKIDGQEAALPPQSLFESSGAEVVVVLQDTVFFQLPPNFTGGNVTFLWTVDGSIGAARATASGPTFAEASVNAGGLSTTRRWTAPGSFLEVLSAASALPALPGFTLPITLTSQLRLSSGSGPGSYDVDLYNTATLSILAPDGVTWTSESGLLLSAVPEPQPLLLLAVGLTLVAVSVRTRAKVELSTRDA
jgi:hypothetical protein